MPAYIIHGTWILKNGGGGGFYTWVETDEANGDKKGRHPFHVPGDEICPFFHDAAALSLREEIKKCYFLLPSTPKHPLLSYELQTYNGLEIPETYSWKWWKVDCLVVPEPLAFLKEIHFLSIYFPQNIRPGEDLLFWYNFSGMVRSAIIKDQYIPGIKCRAEASPAKTTGRGPGNKSRKTVGKRPAALADEENTGPGTKADYTFVSGWEILSPFFEEHLGEYGTRMPPVCTAGRETRPDGQLFYEPLSLLKSFSTQVLESLVRETSFPKNLKRRAAGTFVEACLSGTGNAPLPPGREYGETWKQWYLWKQNLLTSSDTSAFFLCFRLKSPDPGTPGEWALEFLARSRKDPSLQLELADYWESPGKNKTREIVYDFINEGFTRDLLVQLGYAARIYPKLWEGMKGNSPSSLVLSLEEAYEFLKETVLVLENAGYKIIVPSWWTASGKKNFKVRMKPSASSSGAGAGQGFFTLNSIITYEYDLSIGGKPITEREWKLLVEAKKPLVNFRGEWIELDRDRIARVLDFWEKQKDKKHTLSLGELLRRRSEDEDEVYIDCDTILSGIMTRLMEKGQYNLVKTIPGFNGTLREYQKRGVSWLYYLETLGLRPCLADDMGLGKTIEVIALMVYERSQKEITSPSLFIVPTSVMGNWKKEIERFGPNLSVIIHHGPGRTLKVDEFTTIVAEHDIVITSFALVRRDEKLMRKVEWHRIVVDEAQNIKNPGAAQTKAVGKLPASYKIALTGTPIENRLMDLWSIFHFLNPGYLSTAGSFRKTYEIPIQKENDPRKSRILKKLVEPFILRRLKSDKEIINDLPDKIEQKVFCNLTREQASLYQAVVDEVTKTIEDKEGIERKGLILSTLLRLKQICNHPAHYLQDGSGFTMERSYKLSRLSDMADEIIENEESCLVFSQFKEICTALEKYFTANRHFRTYLLHGGTPRKKRETMLEEFQDPSSGPGVFILSLKAGGVGITLTRANHVFHFDRWWNPAVENQATDRAYRIGQEKKVFVHKFVTLGTLEERIDRMLEKKQELSDSIIGSDESWLGDLDNEAFRKLITLSREAVL